MNYRTPPNKFRVAFSFAGEQRNLVRKIAEAVDKRIGGNNVFFDEWFEHYIAGPDADLRLQEIYVEGCDLVVICVSERYGGKPWTQAEHEAIRARMMRSREPADSHAKYAILPIRVGDGDVKGIHFNTIVPDVRKKSIDDTVDLIIERLKLTVSNQEIDIGPKTGRTAPGRLRAAIFGATFGALLGMGFSAVIISSARELLQHVNMLAVWIILLCWIVIGALSGIHSSRHTRIAIAIIGIMGFLIGAWLAYIRQQNYPVSFLSLMIGFGTITALCTTVLGSLAAWAYGMFTNRSR